VALGRWSAAAVAFREALRDEPYLETSAMFALNRAPAPTRDSIRTVLLADPASGRVAACHAGWRGVAAVDLTDADGPDPPPSDRPAGGRLLGVAYGYRGAPDQWWQQQVVRGLRHFGFPPAEIARLMGDYFELTELHIHPSAQGNGLGEALARRLLADRTEAHVLLSTPEIHDEPNRAWRLYRRLGFTDVIRDYHFSGDPRAFAILGRALPL
jgi:ribosomal protein S18 acetylase RimI-like enzyme